MGSRRNPAPGAGSRGGHAPALITILLLGGCATAGGGAEHGRPGGDGILGLHVGDTLEAAHRTLEPLGKGGGHRDEEGGRKEAWRLDETDFATVAFETDEAGEIVWVTGFVRPGSEIPFAALGDLAQAQRATDQQAIWGVPAQDHSYRLVAKGHDGRASVVYLISIDTPQP